MMPQLATGDCLRCGDPTSSAADLWCRSCARKAIYIDDHRERMCVRCQEVFTRFPQFRFCASCERQMERGS